MRIVILYNTSWYVYLLRQNLIRSLIEAGGEVFVVSPRDNYTGRILSLGVRHISLPLLPESKNPAREVYTIHTLLSILRLLKPDAVLSFTVKCNLYAGMCKRFLPFLHIANISGLGCAFEKRGPLRTTVKTLYRLSLQKSEHLFFQNREDLAICADQGLICRERATVIPGSGVDLDSFIPNPGSRSRPRTFLIFGRLLPQKGYDMYLRAAATLRREFGDSAEFWVLGKPDSSRADSMALYHRIVDCATRGQVRYLQSTDDVRPILKECDVVVLPSTYNEGIPRSLLESMASGKPIITTDWKGCRETVRDGVNGLLITPNDDSSLLAAMRELITCSVDKLDCFGRESRKLAETKFDESLVLRAYHEALSMPTKHIASEHFFRRTGTDA